MTCDALDELDWLAFRYIANELSAAECTAFELRLGHDQPAREAVARAVEIAAGLGAAAARPSAKAPRTRWPRAVALAACVMAALGLGLGWRFFTLRRASAPERTLALAWSGLHEAGQPDREGDDDVSEPLSDGGELADLDVLAAADASAAAEGSLPPWLLEAASLRNAAMEPAADRKEN